MVDFAGAAANTRGRPLLGQRPLYPQKRTFVSALSMSAMCHYRTSPRQLEDVFVDLSIFHDHFEVPLRVGDQVEILQRIPIYKQKVCKGALLHHPKLSRIWIAKS